MFMTGQIGKKILITGGAGFIGYHLTTKLVENGAQVCACYHKDRSRLNNMEGVIAKGMDLRNANEVKAVVKSFEPDVIFHIGAVLRSPPYSADDMVATNIEGTYNLLKALERAHFERLIYINTADIYRETDGPIDENGTIEPISIYGTSKAAGEMLCRNFSQMFGFPLVRVRGFLVYGPRQSRHFLIPSCIATALAGEDFATTLGEQRRDPIYIDDFIAALLHVANEKKAVGETFNICTGKGATVRSIIEMVYNMANARGKPLFGSIPYRKPENMNLVGTPEKLRKLCGWESKKTLEQGLQETIEWHRDLSRAEPAASRL